MDPNKYSDFCHEAIHELMRLNDQCDQEFNISTLPRWGYDLDRGTLTFSVEDKPKVVAAVQVVGTTSEKAGTWLWGWANKHLPQKVTEASAKVREFGIAEQIPELTEASWKDDEYLGWKLTSVAAKVLGSKGAYRCPGTDGFVYLVYSSLELAKGDAAEPKDNKQINCDSHGKGFETFVCEHLVSNPAQEWHSEVASEENPWPDAWCSACNIFFEEQGEWNNLNESKMKIKLLCHHCYLLMRSREVPHQAPDISS